jgi:hypothetical protein
VDTIKNSNALRWLLFFPASVLSAVGAYLAIRVVLLLQGYLGGIGDSLWLIFVLNEASHLVFGYLFVAVATAMAPAYRIIVLIVHFFILSTIFAVLTILEVLMASTLLNYIDALGLASAILGGGYYLYQYFEERELIFWNEDELQ